jgi:hypothetical protein
MKKLNKKFKNEYDRIFRRNPAAANLFLMLTELADKNGQVITDEKQLVELMAARFDDFTAYQLTEGGPKK